MRIKDTILLSCMTIISCNLFAKSYQPVANGEVVQHKYYTLSYIEGAEQPEWVYYTLTPQDLRGTAARGNNFRADGAISTGSATLADYKGSGYDRGHLAPAASMTRSAEAMSESFYMSNMSPQMPSFNRGVWKRLEEYVRECAARDSVLHVVTGVVLSEPMGSIGENEVSIPRYYYKALYSPKKGTAVGYLLKNEGSKAPLDEFIVSIDSLERISGVDLVDSF